MSAYYRRPRKIYIKNPPGTVLLALCRIHLSYSTAHQEQSSGSWLKPTAMHFMDVIHEGAVIFLGTYGWEAFCRDTCGLSPGSFAVHQSSGDCTFSVGPLKSYIARENDNGRGL